MMFTEDIPKDLSLKLNPNEIESKVESNVESNDNIIENSIDLSLKTTTDGKTGQSDVEPMDVSLDLSMPSSSVVVNTTELNPKPDEKVEPMDETESQSPSSLVQKSDSEETPSQMTNGNHINGYLASDDSKSVAEVEEDIALPPSPQRKRLSAEDLKTKQRTMRSLKQELRNEEMKLVLLKKLRQSQVMKENIVSNVTNLSHSAPNTTNTTALPLNQSTNKLVSNNISSRNGSISASLPTPNPSVVHNRSAAHSKGHSVLNPPFGRNQSLSHGPIGPPTLGLSQRNSLNHMPSAAHSGSLRPGPLSSMNRTPVTTPPNVVLGYPVQDLRAQQTSNNSLLNSHQSMSLATGSPGPNSAEVTQTPAQRQAAAKLALRKQLEKTLLQIPPPKPPPPEMHFIPNANNQEFVYYLGLETVVDFLTDSPNQNRPPPDPFECVQCGTDFTPVWKWQDRIDPNRDRPAVICETCVTSNIKKALKAEHTNRLKTAFVKALQQEQEIEQRIASGATSPPLPAMSPPPQHNYNGAHQSVSSSSSLVTSSQSLLPQAPPAHSSIPRLSGSAANAAASAAAVANAAALLKQMPNLSAAHQSLFAAQAQQLHQLAQSLPQPAHMSPFAPLLAAQAYSAYGMLGKSGVPSTDLHRQYLLDMIPSRSLPQGSMNWKT